VLGCGFNFWGDFGGNAFTDGLAAGVNSEKMRYAREMLSGRAPPRDDIPCATCEHYLAMRARSRFAGEVRRSLPYLLKKNMPQSMRRWLARLRTAVGR